MTRVLLAFGGSGYPLSFNGGPRVAHDLLRAAGRQPDCACAVLMARGAGADGEDRSAVDRYPNLIDFAAAGIRALRCSPGRWEIDLDYPVLAVDRPFEAFGEMVDAFRPTVVFVQGDGALQILRLAAARGLPGLWFLHSAANLAAQGVAQAAELPVELVCCSRFVARRLFETTGLPATVLYPLVLEAEYRVERAPGRGALTMFNPVPFKGYETLLGLLPLLPEERFQVVEAWFLGDRLEEVRQELARHPNATLLRRRADVREVYRHTELLLAPSVGEEGAGRVVLEAQASGIPALVSPRGGLPEMIGDGGQVVARYRDPEAWAEAVRALRRDPATLQRLELGARAHLQGEEFAAADIVRRFLAVCRRAEARRPQGAPATPRASASAASGDHDGGQP
ncbi:MAG TPA: glycosyltransferase [Thermoanaerobaculia bacterium]|nr:glycosyltransferase [Thermoanaerobaculia bacterium]